MFTFYCSRVFPFFCSLRHFPRARAMSLAFDAAHIPSTSFGAFLDMMKPAPSAKDTETTSTMMTVKDEDDTSSPQIPNHVMEKKTSYLSQSPMSGTTDDDTGATVSMDEEEEEVVVMWKKFKPPSGDPPPSPPPPCTSASPFPPPTDDDAVPFRVLRLRG